MRVNDLKVQAHHRIGTSDFEHLAGRSWPVLLIWLHVTYECPTCSYRLETDTGYVKIEAERRVIDYQMQHCPNALASWLFGYRECPSCGVNTPVPELDRDELVGRIRQQVTTEWVLAQFEQDDVIVVPDGQWFFQA